MNAVATLRQAAILVGGLGTRLGALTADTPKPLLEVAGRPFLAWLLGEIARYGVEEVLLLAGFRSDRIRAALPALEAGLPRPMRLILVEEARPSGTGGALFLARERLDARFLLCNGDSLFDANLARLLAAAAADPPGVPARLLLRRVLDASRYGTVALEGDRIAAFGERSEAGGARLINAGIAVLTRAAVDRLPAAGSLERDGFAAWAAEGMLRGTEAEGWFIDIGIPADLARARAELAGVLRRPALFLDRDGVLNLDHGYVGTRERFEWIAGARAAVRAATDAGWHVFIATNQSGVARGHYDASAVEALMAWVGESLRAGGGTLDDWRYCPFHPAGSVAEYARASDWRKPGPGMLLDLLRAWRLDPARCVMVGDQASDMAAAAAAGMAGHLFPGGDLHRFIAPLLDRRGR